MSGRYRIVPDPRVVASRQRLTAQLDDVLGEVAHHTGWVPRRRGWLLLVAGVAAGFTLALALKRPQGRRQRGLRDPLDPDDLADSL